MPEVYVSQIDFGDGVVRTIKDPNASVGGHTIQDSSGVDMATRAKLKFMNASVTDDSTNDTTIVTALGAGEVGLSVVNGKLCMTYDA